MNSYEKIPNFDSSLKFLPKFKSQENLANNLILGHWFTSNKLKNLLTDNPFTGKQFCLNELSFLPVTISAVGTFNLPENYIQYNVLVFINAQEIVGCYFSSELYKHSIKKEEKNSAKTFFKEELNKYYVLVDSNFRLLKDICQL